MIYWLCSGVLLSPVGGNCIGYCVIDLVCMTLSLSLWVLGVGLCPICEKLNVFEP